MIHRLATENTDLKNKFALLKQSNKSNIQISKESKARIDELLNENMILKLQNEEIKIRTKYNLTDSERISYTNVIHEDKKILRNCNVHLFENHKKLDKIMEYFENFLEIDEQEIIESKLTNFETRKEFESNTILENNSDKLFTKFKSRILFSTLDKL